MKAMIVNYEEDNECKVTRDEPICPDCDITLNEDDCYDHAFEGYYVERLCYGTCPNCGKSYQYKEVFFYGGHSQLKPTED